MFMEDIGAPSFSLGLDFDLDSEPQKPIQERPETHPPRNALPSFDLLDSSDEEEALELEIKDSDPETGPDTPRILKRLRRGYTKEPSSVKNESVDLRTNGGDDEIEEFSSQEDVRGADEHPSTRPHSLSSSSKTSLHGRGVLTTQSSSQWKPRKAKRASDVPASANVETNRNESIFSKLTISPLRKFQIIDSDSDDPSVSKNVSRDANTINPSSEKKPSFPGQKATANDQKRKVSVSIPKNEDLWKDFCPVKNFQIRTPALDEFCQEYFQSVKDKNVAQKVGGNVSNNEGCHQNRNSLEQQWDLLDPIPPSHRYFFHDDTRIQNLVCSRLHNFSPLGVVNNRENKQPSGSVINYMSQFSNGEASKTRALQNSNPDKSLGRGRNKPKKKNAEEGLHASGSWVNPKSTTNVPNDAGKRRVHADGQSTGHWYTNPDGKKVYVNRSGQELTGQIAYRQYRRESGARSRKTKNKTSAKKRKR